MPISFFIFLLGFPEKLFGKNIVFFSYSYRKLDENIAGTGK